MRREPVLISDEYLNTASCEDTFSFLQPTVKLLRTKLQEDTCNVEGRLKIWYIMNFLWVIMYKHNEMKSVNLKMKTEFLRC
jgi:hypothetical protein